jgi:Ca-activated chloride channel homolog
VDPYRESIMSVRVSTFAILLLCASVIGGCDGPIDNLCDPIYDFGQGDWSGGEGSAPGGAAGEGDDDDAAWDDDDVSDDDDAVDDDDATWDDDDVAWDDDDAAWDDDDVADDDDAAWDDDDSMVGDDDDVTDDDDSASGDDGARDEEDEQVDEDGVDPWCEDVPSEPVTQYLSADDSNSQADPSQHREMILHHDRVPTRAKEWEYLNAADFDFLPAPDGTLRIVPELRTRPGTGGEYDLLVGVVAPGVAPQDRRPYNLVFSLDVSGSMGGPGIEMMQVTLRQIAASLQEGDFVSVVLWSDDDAVVLQHHRIVGSNDPTFVSVIDGLISGGSTDLEGGLEAAYELAAAEPIADATSRVVLISDGGANAGITAANLIAQHAQDGDAEGIFLVGIGVPPVNKYDDALMDQLTDLGRGAYLYIDSDCEAERRFTPESLPTIFGVAALDVQLEMTLPAGLVVRRFSGEQIGYSPSDVVPQHLSPNDQMLYDLDLVDCQNDPAMGSRALEFTVRWRDPRTGESRLDTASFTVDQLLQNPADHQRKAEALVAFARSFEAVQEMSTAHSQATYLDELADYLDQARRQLGGDLDLAEAERMTAAWRAMY